MMVLGDANGVFIAFFLICVFL